MIMTPLQEECVSLFQAKQYQSCEIVAQFELSQSSPANGSSAISLELIGDCAQSTQQYRRAISYFRRAALLSLHKDDARLRWKEAQCLSQLGSVMEGASVLERTSNKTFGMHMTLGHLYLASGRQVDAKRSFLEALRFNAYALEAIQWLAILKADRNSVMNAVEQGLQDKNTDIHSSMTSSSATTTLPVMELVSAHFLQHCNQTTSALTAFRKLDHEYPNNAYILLHIATLQLQGSDETNAEHTFRKIRQLDESRIDKMDEYAHLLQKRGAVDELNRLSSLLLEVDDKRPEPWVALSLYHYARQDSEKAMAFVDKAIHLDQRHAFAHRIKGTILLADSAVPEKAAASFFHANELVRDVASYEGLVECYLQRHQYKEAVCMAREAIEIAPRDSRAVTLVGLALSHANDCHDRAKRAFQKALKLDPFALRPLLALVDIYQQEEDYSTCIDLLQRGRGGGNSNNKKKALDMLEARLGEIYTLQENFMEAMTCFHTALSLNPDNMQAQRGMDRLEKVMRGLDPDAPGDADIPEDSTGSPGNGMNY